MAKSLAALQKTEKSQAASIKSLQITIKSLQGKGASQASTIAGLQSTVTSQAGTIAGLQSVVGADASHGLQKSVAAIAANPVLTLSWLPTYLSLDTNAENGVAGPNVVFQACNVHVRSTTKEQDSDHLGNLIVGWDDNPPGPDSNYRTGSNNLICGDGNSFESYGGFLAGSDNSVTDDFSSVSGGYGSLASGEFSSVSGGEFNEATAVNTSVSGGQHNIASSSSASVSGGFDNTAVNPGASVSGGENNTAGGWASSVSGGGGYSTTLPYGLTESAEFGWMAGDQTGSFTVPAFRAP